VGHLWSESGSLLARTTFNRESVTITWIADQPSHRKVDYGTSPTYRSSSPLNTPLTTAHGVVLPGLTPATTRNAALTGEAANAIELNVFGNWTPRQASRTNRRMVTTISQQSCSAKGSGRRS
jgi:hypothetical protein